MVHMCIQQRLEKHYQSVLLVESIKVYLGLFLIGTTGVVATYYGLLVATMIHLAPLSWSHA